MSDTMTNVDEPRRCAKCGELIETDFIFPFVNKRMPLMCACKKAEMEKQKQKEIENYKIAELEKLSNASLLTERYKNSTFENTDMSNESFVMAMGRCKRFCEISDEALANGYGMYIYGGSGVGKTHLTACMVNELTSQFKQSICTNFFKITSLIKLSYDGKRSSNEVIEKLANVDFLFIDDIGTERLRTNDSDSWMQEQIYDFINNRYNIKKPTIFTSNYSLNELFSERGMMDKTVDRINEMSTAIIKINGNSYRKNNKPKNVLF